MISVGFKTDRGVARDGNEDALFVLPEQQLYIVADGVGGHNSGELASRLAVGYIAQYVALHPLTSIEEKPLLRAYFKKCFEGANELIYNKAGRDGENEGMATTAVLCYLREDVAYIVNVGDSRAYLIRDNSILQITEDHTCVQSMLKSGMISLEQALSHPDHNMITRAIGGEPEVVPDFFMFDVFEGDIILLCTDGLYGEMSSERILELAQDRKTMHRFASDLVEEANQQGGKDNISVICIKIQ
ncbi:MAG: Stp1/IreP family PP2C-type Ser/Thr phosphatase [Clostridia bacterium]|nr:Stp1/IreP family PP2C-type Ser/Thr phosphatase [Clostridia bacterium]